MFRSKDCVLVHFNAPAFGFNPCSRGCFARSSQITIDNVAVGGFNPCSRGCFARSRAETPITIPIMQSFNPCSRGCFARSPGRFVPLPALISFNPCSRGCFARREWITDPLFRRDLFQSLFSWMFRSKSLITGSNFLEGRVSILVLVDVSLEAWAHKKEWSETRLFQSLFSWMFRSK